MALTSVTRMGLEAVDGLCGALMEVNALRFLIQWRLHRRFPSVSDISPGRSHESSAQPTTAAQSRGAGSTVLNGANFYKELTPRRSMKIAVVGLGYVGEPLARALVDAGHNVTGYDIDQAKVDTIKAGGTNIPGEPGLTDIPWTNATTDSNKLHHRDAYIIAVSVPLYPNTTTPDFTALNAATDLITTHAPLDTLIIIESTLPPGTTRLLADANPEFRWAHVPERVTAGKALHNLRTMPRVIGSDEPTTGLEVENIYRSFMLECEHKTCCHLPEDCSCAHLQYRHLTWEEAEVAKCLENACRDVEIALANEAALICQEHGADFARVKAAIMPRPTTLLEPGLGVGGHCLTKDGHLLTHNLNPGSTTIIPGARLVNGSMPARFADIIQREVGRSGRILILGEAYMPGSPDTRESPTHAFTDALNDGSFDRSYTFDIIDPHTRPGVRWEDHIHEADAIVLATAHPEFTMAMRWVEVAARMRGDVVVDGRGFWSRSEAEAAGLQYFSLS